MQETKKLACVLDALGYQAIEDKDGYVNLSVADLTRINERMALQLQAAKDVANSSADKETEHAKLVASMQQQIDDLKAEAEKQALENNEQMQSLRLSLDNANAEKAELEAKVAEMQPSYDAYMATVRRQPTPSPEPEPQAAVDYAECRKLFDAINN